MFKDDTLLFFNTRDKSSIEMFPEGIKRHIIWQCLLDSVAPVDIYTYVYKFVCVGGSPTGLILSIALFLPSIPLSFVAAAGSSVGLSAFSMAECGEPVSVCF